MGVALCPWVTGPLRTDWAPWAPMCVCSHAWAPLDVRAWTLVTGPRLLTGPHQLLLPPLVTGPLVTKSFATNWILWDLIGGLPWVGPLDEQLEAH